MPDQETIPVRRVLAGFLIAPLPPALLFSVAPTLVAAVVERNPLFLLQSVLLLPWVVVGGGYLPELFVGLPLYALARRWVRPTLVNCVVAGAFVAALPWAVMAFWPEASPVPGGWSETRVGGQLTSLNGRMTAFGVREALKMIGGVGALGAFGGGVFWAVVAGPWSKNHTVAPDAAA